MEGSRDAVRCVALPLAGSQALLPSALVAEVFAVPKVAAPAGGPDWLLGSAFWRGTNLPVVSLEAATGGERAQPAGRAKSVVIRALGDTQALRYYAVLVQDVPRQVLASERIVQPAPPRGGGRAFVRCEVSVEGTPAFIPDVDALESALVASSAAWHRGGEARAAAAD